MPTVPYANGWARPLPRCAGRMNLETTFEFTGGSATLATLNPMRTTAVHLHYGQGRTYLLRILTRFCLDRPPNPTVDFKILRRVAFSFWFILVQHSPFSRPLVAPAEIPEQSGSSQRQHRVAGSGETSSGSHWLSKAP